MFQLVFVKYDFPQILELLWYGFEQKKLPPVTEQQILFNCYKNEIVELFFMDIFNTTD